MNQTNISLRNNLFGGIDVSRPQSAVGAGVVTGGVPARGINQRYNHAGIFGLSRINKVSIDIEIGNTYLSHLGKRIPADLADKEHFTAAQGCFDSLIRPRAGGCV